MKFKSVIFDCDGVLVDSEILANRVEAEVKTELGFPITLENQIRKFVGMGMSHPEMKAELARLPPHYWDLVDERVGPVYEKELRAIAGADHFLSQLQLPKCVASSSEPDWLQLKLSLAGLHRHFGSNIFHGKTVQKPKPEPDLFLHAAQTSGWSVENCLVIEDSVPGVLAGKAAGMTVCGFLGGSHILADHGRRLSAAGADFLVSSFHEIHL